MHCEQTVSTVFFCSALPTVFIYGAGAVNMIIFHFITVYQYDNNSNSRSFSVFDCVAAARVSGYCRAVLRYFKNVRGPFVQW